MWLIILLFNRAEPPERHGARGMCSGQRTEGEIEEIRPDLDANLDGMVGDDTMQMCYVFFTIIQNAILHNPFASHRLGLA
jgi:hypothetical protein